jgi:aspartyl/asparaginyl beta-hydroxylase (cupin superfamily)
MKPPFFDAQSFAATRAIAAARDVFLRETDALVPGEFADWPSRSAYSNGWQTFPLLMPNAPPGLLVDYERNRRRCPGSWAIVLGQPRVQLAAVSRLLPGCHIFLHSDDPLPDVMRFHMGLRIKGPSGMRFAGRVVEWTRGESFVFDHSHMHEAANLGTEPRDVLLVDFLLTADEKREVERLRAEAANGVP